MEGKMRKGIITVTILLLVTLCSCSNTIQSTSSKLPVNNVSASFSIDVNDLNQIVGDADYVFVAEVVDNIETIYKNKVNIETEAGLKEVSDPYTRYSINVIDNIKGNLKKNKRIDVYKAGGISQDNTSIILYENDEMLEVNKLYILVAYAQPDGTLLVVGPNSSSVIDTKNKSQIVNSEPYALYTLTSAKINSQGRSLDL